MSAPEQPAAPGPCPIPNCGWDAEGTLDDHLYEHDYNELRPTVVRLALETDQLRASRAASHQPQFVQPPADLRQRIAQALAARVNGVASDGRGWFRTDDERQRCLADADAVLAVVRDELDARDASAYQRGLLKGAEVLDAIANTQAMSDPDEPAQTDAEHTRSSARAIRTYAAATARPGCPDPIECDHEAAASQARAELVGARATIDHMSTAMSWIAGHDRQGLDHLEEAQREARARENAVDQAKGWARRAKRAERLFADAHHLACHQGEPRDNYRRCTREGCPGHPADAAGPQSTTKES